MRIFLFLNLFFSCSFLQSQTVTYHEHIAPVIERHCISCHQAGEVAPMPFTTYKEVSSYASMIAFVTSTRYMPPWKVVKPKHSFQAERGMTDQEIDLIKQWIDDGLEEGVQSDNNTSTKLMKHQIANPDVTYAMAESFEQYGVYYDQFRVFVIPTDLEEDRTIESIIFVPGNKEIVRSCQVSIDTGDKSTKLDEWDPQYGYFSFGTPGFVPTESRWYNWHPGKPVTHFPKGSGKVLPKGAKILMHVHYGPTGYPQKDSSYLQINFSDEKGIRPVHTVPLITPYNMSNDTFYVATDEETRVHAKFEVPFDMELHGLFPHSHLLGKRWEIFTVDPSTKQSEVLLKITDWDFKWKQMYDFTAPKVLKKGTIVHALAAYDNTLDNLSNPSNPPREMPWGRRMFEELFLVFFKISELPNNTVTNVKLRMPAVNITEAQFVFDLLIDEETTLTATVKSFDNKQFRNLFSKRKFKKGTHQETVDLTGLKKGNYYLGLTDDFNNSILCKVFLYAEDALLE